MALITLSEALYPSGYVVTSADGQEMTVLVDYGFPGVADTFGWLGVPRHRRATGDRRRICGGRSTDGTVNCPDCGRTATEFISAAADWLDDNIGVQVDDPGYFSG